MAGRRALEAVPPGRERHLSAPRRLLQEPRGGRKRSMALRGAVFIGMLAGLACTHERPLMPEKLQETYVKDFTSSDKACTTADVNLNHSEAEAFFKRAKNIDYRTLNE